MFIRTLVIFVPCCNELNIIKFLKRCLQFDDLSTRVDRMWTSLHLKKNFLIFNENCQRMYSPGEYVTIDEQLLGFWGKYPFRMYISCKSVKYELKLVIICDNVSKYMLTAEPYLGKSENRNLSNLSLGHYYIKHLSELYHYMNSSITINNWFILVPLVIDFFDNCGMTFVRMLRAIRKCQSK